jgi:ABC-type Mn2+/Zn2+ transport system ATPase subunit
MRLKSIFISEYKNLKNFSLKFENDDFLELFVGKNGSGKSNFFEAIIEVFKHLFESDKKQAELGFNYNVSYEIEGEEIKVSFANGDFTFNDKKRKTTSGLKLPDNVLIYYSGQNNTVEQLLTKYKNNFKLNVKSASMQDSRKFIGIGPFYKEMFLALQLLLPVESKAKEFIFSKLGIVSNDDTVILTLKRPFFYAAQSVKIEHYEPGTHYWGVEGITLQFLKDLEQCIKGEFKHQNIYSEEDDLYRLPINIEVFKQKFGFQAAIEAIPAVAEVKEVIDGEEVVTVDAFEEEEAIPEVKPIDAASLFRLIDNLYTLEMVESINAAVTLDDDAKADISYFSDGQFQSVYIYSITEIFKEQNCITLLDEPDSFLHPEWQFEFLDQINEISTTAALTNHILMTSHSAATLTSASTNDFRVFDRIKQKAVVTSICKEEVLKRLSGNRIALNEKDIVMNITNYLKDSTKAVLFTEGITDEYILDIAWDKLYPGQSRPFCINNAFDRRFLKNLFKRKDLKDNYPERHFFGLFDFDDAYDDYHELELIDGSTLVSDDFMLGHTTQLACKEHYVMLLPVLDDPEVKGLVCNKAGQPWYHGASSHLSIELLFYNKALLGKYFNRCEVPNGGERLKFTGKKVEFAEKFVPELPPEAFEIFRPMFNFILQITQQKLEAEAILEAS